MLIYNNKNYDLRTPVGNAMALLKSYNFWLDSLVADIDLGEKNIIFENA